MSSPLCRSSDVIHCRPVVGTIIPYLHNLKSKSSPPPVTVVGGGKLVFDRFAGGVPKEKTNSYIKNRIHPTGTSDPSESPILFLAFNRENNFCGGRPAE